MAQLSIAISKNINTPKMSLSQCDQSNLDEINQLANSGYSFYLKGERPIALINARDEDGTKVELSHISLRFSWHTFLTAPLVSTQSEIWEFYVSFTYASLAIFALLSTKYEIALATRAIISIASSYFYSSYLLTQHYPFYFYIKSQKKDIEINLDKQLNKLQASIITLAFLVASIIPIIVTASLENPNAKDAFDYFIAFSLCAPLLALYSIDFQVWASSFCLSLANKQYKRKRYLQSLKYCRIALIIDAKNEAVFLLRGKIKFQAKDFEGSIADFSYLLEINPNRIHLLHLRALAKSSMGDDKGAIADCTKVLEIDPNNARAYLKRGEYKEDMDDIHGALQDYDKAISLDPHNDDAYFSRALTRFYELDDISGAINDLNRILVINPKSYPTYHFRGDLKEKIGDDWGAENDMRKAAELGSDKAVEWLKSRGRT